jgi:hypothetical protein
MQRLLRGIPALTILLSCYALFMAVREADYVTASNACIAQYNPGGPCWHVVLNWSYWIPWKPWWASW